MQTFAPSMSVSIHKQIKFYEPGNYRLQIQGSVPSDFWNFFEGRVEKVASGRNGMVRTTLELHVRDQVELSGIINLIHDRRLVLLSINIA